MPVIDFHTHVYPEALAPRVVKLFTEDFPINVYGDGTLDGLRAQMRASGVATSVVLPVPTKPQQVESCNRYLEPLLDSDGSLVPFLGVHPDYEGAAELVHRGAERGYKGIKLHPIMQGFKPQEPRMWPIYDAAIEEGMIILFHAGAGMDYDAIRGSKEDFDRFFDRYNYNRVVLAHLGGRPNYQDFPAFKTGWPGYIDVSYSLGMMPDDYLVALARDFGTTRVLFGTDSPWHGQAQDLAAIRAAGFTQAELDDILYNNAAQLLGLG
jgi:predicted TIM-barrel fold metal-dependent hydrolase